MSPVITDKLSIRMCLQLYFEGRMCQIWVKLRSCASMFQALMVIKNLPYWSYFSPLVLITDRLSLIQLFQGVAKEISICAPSIIIKLKKDYGLVGADGLGDLRGYR